MDQEFIEDGLMALTKFTLDRLLKQKNPDELIALYVFYYYTAKWQKTTTPKVSNSYIRKGLKWGEKKVREVKHQLTKLELVSDIRRTDKKGQVTGWFTKVHYIHPGSLPRGGSSHGVVSEGTNAYYLVTEMLTTSNKSSAPKAQEVFSFEEELEKLRKDDRHDLKVIAFYWRKKGWVFENRKQFDAALKRELRAAGNLTGYSGKQVGAAMTHCEKNYTEWSLETVHKRITDIVNVKQ